MAENEYLDSTKARRWIAVVDAMRDGCSLENLVESTQVHFYKTLNKIGQDIPLSELISLIDDPQKLRQRCEEIDGADDVKFHLLEAASVSDNKRGAILEFLLTALQNCVYDIPWLAVARGNELSVSDARRRIAEACNQLTPDLRRIAEKWAENPSWKPRVPRKSSQKKPPIDTTRRMLGESLIAGFRK